MLLLVTLPPLIWLAPVPVADLGALVDWKTIAALAGLMALSRGLELSGLLDRAGRWVLGRLRALAMALVLLAAGLAAIVTNDVALFVTVPLTLGLARIMTLPVGRLVIFQALAVNAGSTLSPVGNPQNLFFVAIDRHILCHLHTRDAAHSSRDAGAGPGVRAAGPCPHPAHGALPCGLSAVPSGRECGPR
ncbi:MAG: hypothetical protein JJU09_00990 [Rhodobacteraceae bacterium]|nr:hypothetical protein [Paracoccaceae bacterium]